MSRISELITCVKIYHYVIIATITNVENVSQTMLIAKKKLKNRLLQK